MSIIKDIGLKTWEIEQIQSILKSHAQVQRAVLYGSRAKGNYKPFSDIDLTLIGSSLNLTTQQIIENQIDDLLLPYKFDFSIYQQIQNKELIEHINRVGILLYDASSKKL